MLKKLLSVLFIGALTNSLFAISTCSDVQNLETFNGHYYGVSDRRMTFNEAKLFAEQKGGYLAIPNSAAENNFIKGVLGGNGIGWIGVYDPSFSTNYGEIQPDRFKDIKGNALSYSNWNYAEPNNVVLENDVIDGVQRISPLGEHWGVIDAITGFWADEGNHFSRGEARHYAIMEFDSVPECYKDISTTVTDTFTNKRCSTQIWDDKTGNLETAASNLDCQTDEFGNTYCPSAVAPCAQEWDYDDGFSVAEIGQVVDTADTVCPAGYIKNGVRCTQGGKFLCNNQWQYFNENNFIKMANWSPSGNISTYSACKGYYDWEYGCSNGYETVSFKTGLRYKCTSPTAVRIEQYHYDSRNGISYGLVFSSLNLAHVEQTTNYVSSRSQHEGWADSRYYVPSGGELRRVYMDGMYFSYKRVGDILTIKVENTYDGRGWTVRDIVEGSVNLNQEATSLCPSGYEKVGNSCKKTIEYTYYNYLCSPDKNSQGFGWEIVKDSGGNCNKTDPSSTANNLSTLDDACNSATPPKNNCKREKFMCQANRDRPCSFIDEQWQCSPFPCFGNDDIEVEGDIEGKNDKKDNGWNSDGSCGGQLYIFNGEDYRCRSSDTFFGLTGGGCCDKDKVFMGLIACKENEKKLAEKAKKELCVQLGEYCSKKIRLGFTSICVQKSKGNCCFGSKLARVIHEEGRPQLPLGWGSGKSPECRGFTIDEFQKLDFSKIDLSNAIDISDMDINKGNNRVDSAIENIKNIYGGE